MSEPVSEKSWDDVDMRMKDDLASLTSSLLI